MSRIADLKPSILQMNPDQLREHIRQIRNDRRVVKISKAKKVKVVKEKTTAKKRVADSLSQMSPAMREALLAELEKEQQT
jgi:hypothetical protein